MIYSLILILGSAQSVGSYRDLAQCRAAATEWQSQGVTAGCVQQADPSAELDRAVSLMQQFIRAHNH